MQQEFYFDGNNLARHVIVTGIARSATPKTVATKTEIPGMDGVMLSELALSPLEITVTCAIKEKTVSGVADARHAIAALLASRSTKSLVLPDDPIMHLNAICLEASELSRSSHMPTFKVKFYCPDPVAYGTHRAQQLSGTAKVATGGTYPSKPVITAKPPAGSSWTVTNVSTGEFVRVPASFSGSQTVVVDCAMQRATVNGKDTRIDLGSDFFALDGLTEIKVSGGSATIEWDERWL